MPIVLLDQPGGRYWEHALGSCRNSYWRITISCHDMRLMRLVHSAEDAVKEIAQFYRNFHSSRWLKALRDSPEPRLNETALAHLHEHFASLCLSGGFRQQAYSEQEQDEPGSANLTRLAFVVQRARPGAAAECWTTSTCRKTGTEAAAPARAQSSLRPFNRRLIDSME